MKKIIIGSATLFALPLLAAAQANTGFRNVNSAIESVTQIVNNLIPLLIGIAILFFIWGLVKYVLQADNDEARKSARSYMIFSVIAFFVMISIWGLVNVLVDTFGLDTQDRPQILPGVPGSNPTN